MIRVGIAGIGFMGWIHWLAYKQVQGAEVGAICTRDKAKLAGDWTSIKGNFGPAGTEVDLAGVNCYSQLDDLMADPDLDLIDICLPPSAHLKAIELAVKHGKHVFCEKPLTVSAHEAEAAVNVARQAERQLLVGHVLPFFPEFAVARDAARDGRFGKPIGGYFKRVISDPLWLKDFYDPHKSGGPLIDLHVHDAHFIRMVFGMPSGLYSVGRMREEVVEHCHTVFEFADQATSVAATCGVINQQGRPFTHGYELQFENATLQFEFAGFDDQAETMPLKILHADGSIERPDLGDGDPVNAFVAEISEVVDCIAQSKESEILSATLARDAIRLCHLQADSVSSRNKIVI